MIIGIDRCLKLVSGYSKDRVDHSCIANVDALLEIRDSATHFVATNALLRKKLTEISLGSVRNYVTAAQAWFKLSFSDLNIASIPISFDLDQKEVDAVAKKSFDAVTKFLVYMENVEAALPPSPNFAFTVRVDFDLIKKRDDAAVKAAVVGGAEADLKVTVEADKVPPGFTSTYNDLIKKLGERYADFKQNADFHQRMKPVKADPKLCYERYVDPERKKGGKEAYFNPNALKALDSHYTRKGATLFEPQPS
jgi:hypothetical protein